MRGKAVAITLLCGLAFGANAQEQMNNSDICDIGAAIYLEQGDTKEDCVCLMDQADKFMTPDLKQSFVEVVFGFQIDETPSNASLFAVEHTNALDEFESATQQICGLS